MDAVEAEEPQTEPPDEEEEYDYECKIYVLFCFFLSY
jgi:hypothetical protein